MQHREFLKLMATVIAITIVGYLIFGAPAFGANLKVSATAPAVVTLTASPQSGPAPLTTTLTWTSTGAVSCKRGLVDVPLNGSVQITGIGVDTQYTVSCLAGQNYSDVTWLAPTDTIVGVDAQGNCITNPIPATGPDSLAGYRLIYNTDLAAMNLPAPSVGCNLTVRPDPIGTVVNIPAPALSYRVTNQSNGTYYYVLAALNQQGQISEYTGPVTNTIQVVSTDATVLVDVQSFSTYEPAVYNVVKKNDGFVMVAVGTVPLNTLCIKTQTVNGYYAVPVAQVTWSGTVRPIVVVAKCKDQ